MQSRISRPDGSTVSLPGLALESVLCVMITGILSRIPSWLLGSAVAGVSLGFASAGVFQSLVLKGHQEGDSSSVSSLGEGRDGEEREKFQIFQQFQENPHRRGDSLIPNPAHYSLLKPIHSFPGSILLKPHLLLIIHWKNSQNPRYARRNWKWIFPGPFPRVCSSIFPLLPIHHHFQGLFRLLFLHPFRLISLFPLFHT